MATPRIADPAQPAYQQSGGRPIGVRRHAAVRAEYVIPRHRGAVAGALARLFVHDLCVTRAVPAAAIGDAALVAELLATTSMRQARADLTVRVEISPDELLIELRDPSEAFPLVPPARLGATVPGYSLELLTTVASAWGYARRPGGRRLWAHIRIDPLAETTDQPSDGVR